MKIGAGTFGPTMVALCLSGAEIKAENEWPRSLGFKVLSLVLPARSVWTGAKYYNDIGVF